MNTLPPSPFDGQIFIDALRIKWVYDGPSMSWTKIGPATDIPIARSEDDENGPTNGLMSAKQKALLDSLHEKEGGFGILLKPGRYITNESGVDSVLTGDVKVTSNSLEFECSQETQANDNDVKLVNVIKTSLNCDFIESFNMEVQGPQGPKGDKGPKGDPGRPGTGDGPKGDPGKDGKDATELHDFSGVIIEDSNEIHDSAVVDLKLDAPNGILEVTKAKMDVPRDDKPATRVAASPILRGIKFNSDNLDKWEITAPDNDAAGIKDVNLIKLPKGWTGDSTSPVPVNTIKLSSLIQFIVNLYKTEAEKTAEKWDEKLKEWAIETDTKAREILHQLATDLAECQFEAPLEFCLGISPKQCFSGAILSNVLVLTFIDETEGNYYPDGNDAYNSDLVEFRNLINNNKQSFEELRISVWMPDGDPNQLIPDNEELPDEFETKTIDRPPSSSELIGLYQDIINSLSTNVTDFDNIFILIDNSGSMTTSDIQPGYGSFISWLSENSNANIVEKEFSNERFISEVTKKLEEALNVSNQ